jgi:hypothetical protein
VVHNPVPVTLIGAGIAWLALSGAMGRRGNGNGHSPGARADIAHDWGETAATAHDLAHGDRRGAGQHARQTAEGWVDEARDAMSEAGGSVREGMGDLRDRAGTMYDESVGQARQTAEGWAEDAREGASHMRERAAGMAGGMYDQTVSRARRATDKAAQYGRAARHAIEPDGALMTFCREQPMLVAGLGVAFGAALAAMIPASRTETRIMGEASRNVRDRMTEVAAQGLRTAAEAGEERRPDQSSESEAAADVERGLRQANERPNVEGEPQSEAPYAEAAEAGAAGPGEPPGEVRSRT